jgi:hypothetical protein
VDPNLRDIITLSFSGLAVLVSIAAIFFAWRTSSRQNALQERMLAFEDARERDRLKSARSAEVRASIQREAPHWRESRLAGKGPQYWLVVRNEGLVTARNIRVLLDGKSVLEHPLVPRGEDEVKTLGPGAESRYILAVTMGGPSVLDARIDWEDDSGQSRQWESQLKV